MSQKSFPHLIFQQRCFAGLTPAQGHRSQLGLLHYSYLHLDMAPVDVAAGYPLQAWPLPCGIRYQIHPEAVSESTWLRLAEGHS